MNSKLTLTIEKSIIEKAKQYAHKSGRSLSSLIEAYLEKITQTEVTKEQVPDEFKELFGSVNFPSEMDDKKIIRSIMQKKNRK